MLFVLSSVDFDVGILELSTSGSGVRGIIINKNVLTVLICTEI